MCGIKSVECVCVWISFHRQSGKKNYGRRRCEIRPRLSPRHESNDDGTHYILTNNDNNNGNNDNNMIIELRLLHCARRSWFPIWNNIRSLMGRKCCYFRRFDPRTFSLQPFYYHYRIPYIRILTPIGMRVRADAIYGVQSQTIIIVSPVRFFRARTPVIDPR